MKGRMEERMEERKDGRKKERKKKLYHLNWMINYQINRYVDSTYSKSMTVGKNSKKRREIIGKKQSILESYTR